jgi:replicative DNA helicase
MKQKEGEPVKILAKQHNEINRYTWGGDFLDEQIKTLKRGKLAVMVADENQGKSTFCFFMARKNFEAYGHKVVYFNLEQTEDEIYHDDAMSYAGITKIEERDEKYLTNEAYNKRLNFLKSQKNVKIIGRKADGIMPIDDIIESVNAIGELDYLILDNLTCIGLKEGLYNELEATKEIITRLISMAQKINIPVLLVHHYRKKSQASQTKIFRDLHDLAGSGVIKNLASIVIQVARNFTDEDKETRAEFWIKEGKVRGGGTRDEICSYFHKGDFYSKYEIWNTVTEEDFKF